MLYLYPSNKLEDLSVLLAEVVKNRPKNPLEPTNILVPNPGMQHWLSTQIAEHLGVAMNFSFPLPSRFMWDLCRDILGADAVPKQSPYKREVLVWRIYQIVDDDNFATTPYFSDLEKFWNKAFSPKDMQMKKYLFSQQLADVFEQYQIFRTQWLQNWEARNTQFWPFDEAKQLQNWQAWFWQELLQQESQHPDTLQKLALTALSKQKIELPQDIYVFALNSVSKSYLDFLNGISAHTNVHFFHLNPCVNYWGDAQSDAEKARINRLNSYKNSTQEDSLHPLLRNLGKQGRDLTNLLTDLSHFEISAFDTFKQANNNSASLLSALQNDILHGEVNQQPDNIIVEQNMPSIAVHGCHSAARELQVLKDSLLNAFANDETLQPKDILVMCPKIEDYSPYINAIFQSADQTNTNIPVSISDRKPIESEPLLVALLTLLKLPQGRFSASQVIDFISLECVANKFKLSSQDLDLCAHWLVSACVDWGLDENHLSSHLGVQAVGAQNTWQQGISRLMTGLINANDDSLVLDSMATAANIEGQNAVVFGRLLQCIEQLSLFFNDASRICSVEQWLEYLSQITGIFFDLESSSSLAQSLLNNAIRNITQNVNLAHFNGEIDLVIFTESLESLLNIPETRSQFYSGRVTFCSMLPMRSIPFKVIAILGLNDSDFPRQDLPLEINLMSYDYAMPGDRSRRGDDRYLFLESIISARQYLHLSYQYRTVKDNTPRQESLVIQLLLESIKDSYPDQHLQIVEHGLHPFSKATFEKHGHYLGCYDHNWWKQADSLIQLQNQKDVANLPVSNVYLRRKQAQSVENVQNNVAVQNGNSKPVIDKTSDARVTVAELTEFYRDTCAYFVKHALGVYLSKSDARDFAVNYRWNGLVEYHFKNDVIAFLQQAELNKQGLTEQGINQYWKNSGKLPYWLGIDDQLSVYTQQAKALFQAVNSVHNSQILKGELNLDGYSLAYNINLINGHQIQKFKLNPGEPGLNKLMELWIEYLILLVLSETKSTNSQQFSDLPISAKYYFIKKTTASEPATYSSLDDVELMQIELVKIENHSAKELLVNLLRYFVHGREIPLLLDYALAASVLENPTIEEAICNPATKSNWLEAAEEKSEKASIGKTLPNPNFTFLFGTMPEYSEENLRPYFECLAPVHVLKASTVKLSSLSPTAINGGNHEKGS